MDRRRALIWTGASLLAASTSVRALAEVPAGSSPVEPTKPVGTLTEPEIDSLAEAFRARFDVPGLAVTVVRPGMPAFAKGYGQRRLDRAGAVDEHTLFAVASNSKAFTTALLAMLVDAGKLQWDAPVQRYLPEFELHDPVVTRMFTVRDLLIHNSGLPLGAGDLMFFPMSSHTLGDILHGLRYLKPSTGFRTTFAYDNLLYLVAGMIVTRLTGLSWADAVTTRILKPLGMAESVAAISRVQGENVAGRHARLGPPVRGMGPMKTVAADEQDKIGAAGGLNTSAHDAAKWLAVQLAKGKLPDGSRLWSEAQADEMWKPRTIVSSGKGPDPEAPTRPVISAYALGWGVGQYHDQRLLSHMGGLQGQITQHALLPELGCGLAVYSNVEDNYASVGLRNALLDRLIGAPAADWLALASKRRETTEQDALKDWKGGGPIKPEGAPSLPLSAYAGRYRDPWYGDIVVREAGGALAIDFVPTPEFKGALEVWGKDAFRTRFANTETEDAVVHFAVAAGRVTTVTMKALSPLADFSFDFHDLNFVPVQGGTGATKQRRKRIAPAAAARRG
ncbi:serine hydrolase [Novosphingobium sp.]|uniref:serine hydrolase n=1 Tax=Novosphingobium sp. TaxID=1874826 RepID=UPI003BACCE00